MSIIARQSTARTVMVGPVLDASGVAVTDGVVGDLKISKNGAAPAALNGSATLTHRHTGFYSLACTATDLDTVGAAQVTIDDTVNSMPMLTITVIEEAVYDALFAASAVGPLLADATGAGLTALPWNASWDAEVESEVTDALNATIADSIPADGTRPSISQAAYMLTQFMLERSVSGTTLTVKKADGSTTLLTLTLNDATNPTSITRAT